MYSALSTLNTTTEVPLSKAPNPQLLPRRRSINGCPCSGCVFTVCVFTAVCVHFGWVNCRARHFHFQNHGFSYHCYADGTQLYLSFHPDNPTIGACISAHLTDISCWMKDRHLQPCQDRTACGSNKSIVSSQFHHPVRHINHNSFN